MKFLVENNLNSSNHSSNITRNNKNKNSYEQSVFKERIPIKLYEHSKFGSKAVALEIANLIKDKQKKGSKCVLSNRLISNFNL